jgi:hypothetical protein
MLVVKTPTEANHSFRKSRDEVAQIIIEWIKINNKDK